MKALVGAFNQEKALVGAFSVIVQPVVEPMEQHTALPATPIYISATSGSPEDVARGYKNSRGFKQLLPFPFLGQFPGYEDTEAEDLRSYFRQLMRGQGARSAVGGWVW